MRAYGTVDPNNYTIEDYTTTAEIEWTLVSSSLGVTILYPSESAELSGSVTISRAKKEKGEELNNETGVYEHILYSSIKHLFYDRGSFISGSTVTTSSLAGLPDNSFVFSIGQNLYGNKIEPGTFEVTIHPNSSSIQDDKLGNLYVEQSGIKYYIGNIFYQTGIAIITHATGSSTTSINTTGLKIVNSSQVSIKYNSNVTFQRYEVIVKLKPTDFNFSPLNPSTWDIYDSMMSGVIKPYITSVGLYNDRQELLAVAKLSKPIQRSFGTEQIFIIRFDAEYE